VATAETIVVAAAAAAAAATDTEVRWFIGQDDSHGNRLISWANALSSRYTLDDYRSRNYRQPSPSRDDELEDIQERLKGLIIKIGDKVWGGGA
jgi:hypothetical protein